MINTEELQGSWRCWFMILVAGAGVGAVQATGVAAATDAVTVRVETASARQLPAASELAGEQDWSDTLAPQRHESSATRRHRIWDETHPADLSEIAEPATNAPATERRHSERAASSSMSSTPARAATPRRRSLPQSHGEQGATSKVTPARKAKAARTVTPARQAKATHTTTPAVKRPASTQQSQAKPVYVNPTAAALPQTGAGDSRATTMVGLLLATLVSLLGFAHRQRYGLTQR